MKRLILIGCLGMLACTSGVVKEPGEQRGGESTVQSDSDTAAVPADIAFSGVQEDAVMDSLAIAQARDLKLTLADDVVIDFTSFGEGNEVRPGSFVSFEYEMKNERGDVLDGTKRLGRPIAVKQGLGMVMEGLDSALVHLREGDKALIELPPGVGVSEPMGDLVRPGESVYYLVKVKSVLQQKDVTDGVKVFTVYQGGGAEISAGDQIGIDYFGYTDEGSLFSSSRQNGDVFEFTVGKNMVPLGLDKAIQGLHIGDQVYVELSPEMAYGQGGLKDLVPPGSGLIYLLTIDYKK